MGLDMYLFRKDGNDEIIRVGYWRKANAIHNWFVQNVQNGIDECQETPVSLAQLADLRTDVKAALEAIDKGDNNVVEQVLPTRAGFFFGSTEYDQWYIQDLKETLKIVDVAIEGGEGLFYQSSW